jgi:hypothetical protein
VRSALAVNGGNKSKAAQELGISRCYLHRLLNQLTITEYAPVESLDEDENMPPLEAGLKRPAVVVSIA